MSQKPTHTESDGNAQGRSRQTKLGRRNYILGSAGIGASLLAIDRGLTRATADEDDTEDADEFAGTDDFSDSEAGSEPEGWTSPTGSGFEVVDAAGRVGDAAVELTSSEATAHILEWVDAGEFADGEIAAIYDASTATGNDHRLFLRTQNDGDDAYFLEPRPGTDEIRIRRYSDGGLLTLETASKTLDETDGQLQARFRVEGDELMGKAWNSGEDEPDDWDVETTSIAVEGAGVPAIGTFNGPGERWSVVSAATGDTTASLPEPISDPEPGTGGTVDRPADTRVMNLTGPSGVRIQVEEDLSGLDLTISEETSGADTAEIADAAGDPLATKDISGLGPGDSFEIEHDLEAGEEYIVLAHADYEPYDRGDYDAPEWPYDGEQFQVVEGVWDRDNGTANHFYAYTKLTALVDDDGDNGDDDDEGTVDRPADTRQVLNQTGPSGVRIEAQEDMSGLELTISEETTGVDTAEIANAVGSTLATEDISGLGPGDSFEIEYDLEAGEEYIVLVAADDSYDRGDYDEPEWPYDGGQFQVVEGIWGRDNSSSGHFYAYTKLTALVDDDDGDDDNGDDEDEGTIDRPADTRQVSNQTGPSGVRVAVEEDLSGLELTISEETTGVDTAEIANAVGSTLATEDISGLGPGDSFEIEYDLEAGEEYIVLVYADGSYDRGDYDDPDWPYDGGQFQVVEGIWGRDNSSSGHFYAYTKLTALQ